jgi:hypothetical protein
MDTIEYKNQIIDKLSKVVNKEGFRHEYLVEMIHNGTSGNIKVKNREQESVFGIDTFYKEFTVWFSVPPIRVGITPNDGELHTKTGQLYGQLNGIRLEQQANEESRRAGEEQDKLREQQTKNLSCIDKLFERVK